jgi:hypothetical protein
MYRAALEANPLAYALYAVLPVEGYEKAFNNFALDRPIDKLFALSESGKIALQLCPSNLSKSNIIAVFNVRKQIIAKKF